MSKDFGGVVPISARDTVGPGGAGDTRVVTLDRGHLQEHLLQGCHAHAVTVVFRGGQGLSLMTHTLPLPPWAQDGSICRALFKDANPRS